MAIINQTNRTVLMEEINPEKLDMLTLVGDVKGIDSLSDDKIKEINDNLLVSSFDKFLEKFDPTIYSYYNAQTIKKSCTHLKSQKIYLMNFYKKFILICTMIF